MNREVKIVSEIMKKYLKSNNIDEENYPWTIQNSKVGGIGVFAKRDIKAGEIIFKDFPLIIGPRTLTNCPLICVNCYKHKKLRSCEKGCGLAVCSVECEVSETHLKECRIISRWKNKNEDLSDFFEIISKYLTPIRSLLLNEFQKQVLDCLDYHEGPIHGFEVDTLKHKFGLDIKEDEEKLMRRVCCIMDTNSFEVLVGMEENQSSLRGLYPLSSLMNHCCVPNTMHLYDDQQTMIVKACVDIPENSEIFHSYTRIIWSTLTRQLHLKRTKQFLCQCVRCSDPTEFGTFMGAINCFKCNNGLLLPLEVHKVNTPWGCNNCGETFSKGKVGTVVTILGNVLKTVGSDGVESMLMFLKNKLIQYVPESNQIAVELKCKCIWIWGYKDGYLWKEINKEYLFLKASFCKDILSILDKLRVGKCKLRGLLLFELYQTLKTLQERYQIESSESLEQYFKESCQILKEDISAPLEIKEMLGIKN